MYVCMFIEVPYRGNIETNRGLAYIISILYVCMYVCRVRKCMYCVFEVWKYNMYLLYVYVIVFK